MTATKKAAPGAGTPKAAKAGTMQRIAFPASSISKFGG